MFLVQHDVPHCFPYSGFKGCECDIIILSWVRSQVNGGNQTKKKKASVGFLNDYRRMNVALTRAKYSLWVVGNAEVLTSSSSDLWHRFLLHLKNMSCVRSSGDFNGMLSQWRAAQKNR